MNDDTPQTTGPVEYYQQHWERLVEMHGTPVCVMCSGKTWSVYGGNLVPTGHLGSGPTGVWTAVVTVRCVDCGQLLFFDAMSLMTGQR